MILASDLMSKGVDGSPTEGQAPTCTPEGKTQGKKEINEEPLCQCLLY
jgi:hypothetical protein